jgi:organic hydroperoxide reductase OsmC/OhrA
MATKIHKYQPTIIWTGNNGSGTTGYNHYGREYDIMMPGKTTIACSADPTFLGNPALHNPEDLFVSAIAGCHMLWYLHLCAEAGVIVHTYTDDVLGVLEDEGRTGGQIVAITLRPKVGVTDETMIQKAIALHAEAGAVCFLARSLNFKVKYEPIAFVADIST